jgi:hypothetical protein
MAAKTFTIDEISEMIEVKPRTIRKILRANESINAKAPGRGGRWLFAEKDLPKIKSIIESARANASVIDLDDVEA